MVDVEEGELARIRKGAVVDPAEDAEEDAEETDVEAVGDEVTRLEILLLRVEVTDVDEVGDELARFEALLLCADVGDELAMLEALGVEAEEDGAGDELASWLIDVAWLVDCVPWLVDCETV